MKRLLVVAGTVLIAACGGEQYGDLKQELNTLTKDLRGRVDPLPQVKPYEPVPYKAEGEVDPFRPQRINVAQVGGAGAGAPENNRTWTGPASRSKHSRSSRSAWWERCRATGRPSVWSGRERTCSE